MSAGVLPQGAEQGDGPGAARRPSSKSTERSSRRAGLLLIAPYLAALVMFGIYPTVYALYLSLVNRHGTFVGLDNFAAVIADYRLTQAVKNVLLYMAICVPVLMLMTLATSLILQMRRGPLTTFTRVVLYLPGAFTGTASVLMWFFIMDPELGPFSWLLRQLNLTYITDVVTFGRLPLIFALMTFTAASGGWIVIMYGALNSVGNDLLEASQLDGAGAWSRATRIQLPLIRKYVVYMFILTFAGAAQIFTEPTMFASILKSSRFWSLNQLSLVLGIGEAKTGESAAISLMLLLLGLVCALWLVFKTRFFESNVED